MEPRLNVFEKGQNAVKTLFGIGGYLKKSSIGVPLQELIHFRLSQINGCAYCLDMHSKDARANGETEQRLYGLEAWRETPYYSARERVALEWTEALTLVSETHVPDDVYARVREQFSEDELVHLSLAIVAINGWNRLNVAARTVPGDYVAGSVAKLHPAS